MSHAFCRLIGNVELQHRIPLQLAYVLKCGNKSSMELDLRVFCESATVFHSLLFLIWSFVSLLDYALTMSFLS